MKQVIIIVYKPNGEAYDVEIPLEISANQLIAALHQGLRMSGPRPAAVHTTNPIAYLCGERSLASYGLRDGTSLFFYEG